MNSEVIMMNKNSEPNTQTPAGSPDAVSNTASPYRNPQAYKREPKRYFSPTETALALWAFLLGYLFIRWSFADAYLGKTVLCFAALGFAWVCIVTKKKTVPPSAFASFVICALIGASFLFCKNGLIQFFDVIGVMISFIYFLYKSFDTSVESSPGKLFFFDIVKAACIAPFSGFGRFFPALFSKRENKNHSALLWVLTGFAASVIPTSIVISLLSYDGRFSELLSKLGNIDVVSRIASLIFGIPVAMYLFGLFISSSDGANSEYKREKCLKASSKMKFIPTAATCAMTAPMIAVYAAFFFSQWSYYVSAFSGSLPFDYSYSEYARNGFFELCAVVTVNAIVLLLCGAFEKRSSQKAVKAVSLSFKILLILSTLVLVATAVSKMLLYIGTYGLTVSRVLSTCFMAFLAVVFILFAVGLFKKNFNAMPAVITVAAVMLIGLSFSNVPAVVSKCNAKAVQAGVSVALDRPYFESLGADAIPDAIALRDDENVPEWIRINAKYFVDGYIEDITEDVPQKDPLGEAFSFNIPDLRAKKAIEAANAAE